MMSKLLFLDVRTLITLIFWGNLMSVVLVCSFLLFVKPTGSRAYGYKLLAAKAFQVVAFALIIFRDDISTFLSVNMGNSLLFIGFYFEALVLYQLMGENRKSVLGAQTGITLASLILFNLVETIHPSASIRVTIASLVVVAIILIPCLFMLFKKQISIFKRVIGVFYLIFILMLLPRGYFAFMNLGSDIFSNTPVQSITFLSQCSLVFFSLSSCLLLMKEDSDTLISSMATTDYLTGLSNRHSFNDTMNTIFNRHKRLKQPLCVLYLDLDHFKAINDTHGHLFGDEVLSMFAEIVKNHCRDNDLSCRYGGEEFVMVLTNANINAGHAVSKRVMDAVKKLVFHSNPEFTFTISIGLTSSVPLQEEKVSDFLHRADRALYTAKSTGRNKVVEFEDGCKTGERWPV